MSDTSGGGAKAPRSPWYRRRAVLVGGALAVVVAVTVITDLPVHTSRAADISSEKGVLSELNTDLAPCAYAVHEAVVTIWGGQSAGTLTASDRATSVSLLRDDQSSCSYTSETIYDLSNIEVPGSPAGKELGDLVATATLWSTSDALQAIEAVQALMHNGNDSGAQRSLSKAEARLAEDRRAGLAEEGRADRILDTRLPGPDLPVLPGPGT